MYISVFAIVIIVIFLLYYISQTNKNTNNDLEIINLILAVSFIEKTIKTKGEFKDQSHRYAFLLQYFLDMNNLKVDELNNKWMSIYSFFKARTRHTSSNVAFKYLNYGRIHPDMIILIADMYKENAFTIGNYMWEDTVDSMNSLGKEFLNMGNFYFPENFKDLVKAIARYDQEYTGHVLMDKRN